MSSQDVQVPSPVLFPRATVELFRMAFATVMATFGLTILFLVAAIFLAPGSLRGALAAPEAPPVMEAQQRLVQTTAVPGALMVIDPAIQPSSQN